MKRRFGMIVLFWLGLIAMGVVVSILAQGIWIANGATEINAMGVRGYIQGASVILATWYFSDALGTIEESGDRSDDQ